MKKSQLRKLIKEEINFILGPMPGGDPDKHLSENFYITFKNPGDAEGRIEMVNDTLKESGLDPIEYENIGIVFPNPTNQQMSAVLRAFKDADITGIGRTDITGI